MDLGVAEFQKLHRDLSDLYKDGKYEELMKHYTDDCYFLTPFHAPYSVKGYCKIFARIRKSMAGKMDKIRNLKKTEINLIVK